MDGIGIGAEDDTNAVHLAKTPVLDRLQGSELYRTILAHGPAVGLPTETDMGNSEVGHNAMGAGRIFDQGSSLVTRSITRGKLFKTKLWHDIEEQCIIGKGTLHFIGLLSDGNVHSHIEHLISMILYAAANGFEQVCVHTILDGRDVGERTAPKYLEALELLLHKINVDYEEMYYNYRIASGGGRMKVTMDRYNADWEAVRRGWYAHVLGEGRRFDSAKDAVLFDYTEHPYITDQELDDFVIEDNGQPVGKILDGDCVINFNFRGDRALEISRAFDELDFDIFDRKYVPDVIYAGMMLYDGDRVIPKNFLVSPPEITEILSEYICDAGIKSFAVAETQKFGHLTYFWNGNRSDHINESLENYIEIPTGGQDPVQNPAMKAEEVANKAIELLRSGNYRFGRVNFANIDMAGHTGDIEATIASVEFVDECVGNLISAVKELDGIAVITSDHGNADEMIIEEKGKKVNKTAHSRNPVPFAIFDPNYNKEYVLSENRNAGLANIASTILNLMGYKKLPHYESSLITFL
jgi:2,3-bisphosphoglycerate-independent phosphoglycerate mutase